MLKFIWNSWWRNKERFILLMVGVLILSTGLSYLIGITQANNGTIVDELQKRWKSSYHIVVRPEGSRSVTEDLNLLEPNYLSGLEGGISLDQYEQIKQIADVDIAAPIAMIGSDTNFVEMDNPDITEPGIYRMNIREETNTGASIEIEDDNRYVTAGAWMPMGTEPTDYGISPGIPNLSYGTSIMIAGIDPEAEAKMAGIDKAIVASDNSRYFNEEDQFISFGSEMGVEELQIPVIISNQDFVDSTITYSFEKLDIPFETDQQAIAEEIKTKGGEKYLEEIEGTPIKEFSYNTTDVHKKLIEKILNPSYDGILRVPDFSWVALKPSAVKYNPVTSPFPERWPFSYEIEPFNLPEDSLWATKHMYRQFNPYSEDSSKWPRLRMNFIGVFDPQKLKISKDPLTELPMETYFPAKAQWVMDPSNNPVNPPAEMKPTNDDYGFLTKPPLVLTTLEAAAQVLGDTPISAIRVNVKGVEVMDEKSEKLLQEVAAEIEQKTGLITDITLGSSPQLALTHLPGLGEEDGLGWVQQPWIKIGSSISIFKEAKIGLSGVIASVILVAIVYVFSSNLIMMYARKKEFAVLLALGWRPANLSKMLFLEATILGLIVAFISWLILGVFMLTNSIETSALRIFLIGICGLAIYWIGSIIPAWLVQKIKPYETMRSGEVSHRYKRIIKAETIFGMSMNYLFIQWKRSVLSIISIAVPTSLFIFFLFVTFRLKGVMYATWLGEYVALEVGPMHYVAMAVALLIAILTSAEIMWQNVAERQPQIAVLKATGWQNKETRLLVLYEGFISGLIAGIIGLGISLVIIAKTYGQFPSDEIFFLAGTLIIPVITGVIGAVLPAERAVKIQPYQAISGGLSNSKKTEKQFKAIFGFGGVMLFAGILMLLFFSIPDIEKNTSENIPATAEVKTEGDLGEVSQKPIETAGLSEEKETAVDGFSELKEEAWKVLSLGESTSFEPFYPLVTFSEPESPASNLKPENPENTLLSIAVSLEDVNEVLYDFKPHGYKVFDEKGKEYSVVNVEKIQTGDWNKYPGQYGFLTPGEIKVLVTFEVPKNHGNLVLFVNTLEYASGTIVVDIPAASNASNENTLLPEARAEYDLDVLLDEENTFHISAQIDVMNESQDAWKDIGFYFIPNAFTEEFKSEILPDASEVSITEVSEAGKEINYELTNNKLLLKLDEELAPGETKLVKINYSLQLPEDGIRLSKSDDNYHLAQWYPMLAHYQDGWKIEDFDIKGESYHTSYGTYKVDYELPKDYLAVSSANDGEIKPASAGTLKGENIKDFYLALLDPEEWTSQFSKVNDTTLRVFLPNSQPDFSKEMIEAAGEAFGYFEERLGNNPFQELDIIANNGNMEYPNVIEVSNDVQTFEHTLVHEIAHQWFYHLVSNNPFEDAWLDEGLTEFTTASYLTEKYGDELSSYRFSSDLAQAGSVSQIVNLPLDEFESGEYVTTVYGKTPLLLRDFFKDHGGQDEAVKFLSAYFNEYQFRYVDSRTFSDFFEAYFVEDQSVFLEGWLELGES